MTNILETIVPLFGYLSALLVFITFYMKSMMTLRILAISSNVTSLIYTLSFEIWPFAILHAALLPLNCLRLHQIRKMITALQSARKGDVDMKILYPLMQLETFKAGEVIFEQNQIADKAYYIESGVVHLPEVDIDLPQDSFFGEMGLFLTEKRRTSSARCKTDCTLYSLTEAGIVAAFHQHPHFAFHLMSLITTRLSDNQARLSAALARAEQASHAAAHS